jgi:hypothetical protein
MGHHHHPGGNRGEGKEIAADGQHDPLGIGENPDPDRQRAKQEQLLHSCELEDLPNAE